MPTIIWCGNQPWDTDFPESVLPNRAKAIDMPADIFKSSMAYGMLPLVLCGAIIAAKWLILQEREINPVYVPIGILLGLLLMPVHELLHALCYEKGQKVYIGISLKKFAAFAVCHEPISKRRFIVMSLMPVLLGVVPFVVFLLAPPNGILSGICIPLGVMGVLSPMPDYMAVSIVCRQVPPKAYVHTQNHGFYWYNP